MTGAFGRRKSRISLHSIRSQSMAMTMREAWRQWRSACLPRRPPVSAWSAIPWAHGLRSKFIALRRDVWRGVDDIVEPLRNQQTGPNVYPGVPAEYTNWRDEQQAWQQSCVLFNQCYHMVDLAVEGPDALKMLNHLGVNSFEGFVVDKAKPFIPCTPEGYVIGDVILFHLDENKFNLVGRAPVIEWVEYHAATGGYDVQVERDERMAQQPQRKKVTLALESEGVLRVMSSMFQKSAREDH